VRRYSGGGTYIVKNLTTADDKLVIADDYSEPDGNSVLSFGQAQEKAKPHRVDRKAGQYTIAAAMDDYLKFLEGDGRGSQTIRDARYRDKAFIRPRLGDVEVTALTADKLRHWRDGLVKTAPRLRTRKGEKQKHRTVTAMMRYERAAHLPTAYGPSAGGTQSRLPEWKAVPNRMAEGRPFKNVDTARLRYLTIAEAQRLINASEPDFRQLVQAALQTGARYSELARLTVTDFNLTLAPFRSGRANLANCVTSC
jgi:integrase